MYNPLVSIIIPTYDDWEKLELCLIALDEQTFPQEKFEIIVVNNNPVNEIPKKLFIRENCLIICEKKMGSYAARNAALRLAKGKIIGFTDSDCIPDHEWIEKAVATLEKNNNINRLGGQVKIFSKKNKPSTIELYDTLFAFHQEQNVKNGLSVTANFFTYHQIFDKVGFFNDNTMSGGDFEWGMRAQKMGYNIFYSEDVIVYHPARESLRALVLKARRVGKGQAIFSNGKEDLSEVLKEIVVALYPRRREIKFIFNKGKDLMFLDKTALIGLRYLVRWSMDFSRIMAKLNLILKQPL